MALRLPRLLGLPCSPSTLPSSTRCGKQPLRLFMCSTHNQTLPSADARKLVLEVKDKLGTGYPDLPVGKNGRDDEDLILWFLKDRRFSVEDAVFKLTKAIKWRQEFGVSELTKESVRNLYKTGKAYVHDFLDVQGRPVLVVVASKHFPEAFFKIKLNGQLAGILALPSQAATSADLLVEEWRSLASPTREGCTPTSGPSIPSCWSPPAPGEVKINVDGATTHSTGAVGIVCRDHRGTVQQCFANRASSNCPMIVEALAFKAGLRLAAALNCPATVEGDAKVVADSINNLQAPPWRIGNIIEDCRRIVCSSSSISVKAVPRLANQSAHALASFNKLLKCNPCWDPGGFPDGMRSILLNEMG